MQELYDFNCKLYSAQKIKIIFVKDQHFTYEVGCGFLHFTGVLRAVVQKSEIKAVNLLKIQSVAKNKVDYQNFSCTHAELIIIIILRFENRLTKIGICDIFTKIL